MLSHVRAMIVGLAIGAAGAILAAQNQRENQQLRAVKANEGVPVAAAKTEQSHPPVRDETDFKKIDEMLRPVLIDQSPSTTACFKALDRAGTFVYEEEELSKVLGDIGKKFGINVVVDENDTRDAGVELTDEVSIKLENVSLRSCLLLLCQPRGLDFIVTNGSIQILSGETAKTRPSTRVYPAIDLAVVKSGHEMQNVSEDLVDVIENTIEPDSWADNGGDGRIEFVSSAMSFVVMQTDRVHDRIADLFQALRDARRTTDKLLKLTGQPAISEIHRLTDQYWPKRMAASPDTQSPAENPPRLTLPIAAAVPPELIQPLPLVEPGKVSPGLRKILDRKIDVTIQDRDPADAARMISNLADHRVFFDPFGVRKVESEEKVSISAQKITVESALRKAFEPLDYQLKIHGDFVLITPETSEKDLTILLYPVADLLAGAKDKLDALREIEDAISEALLPINAEPRTQLPLKNRDEQDKVVAYDPYFLLVIRHTPASHEKVQAVLATLRKSAAANAKATSHTKQIEGGSQAKHPAGGDILPANQSSQRTPATTHVATAQPAADAPNKGTPALQSPLDPAIDQAIADACEARRIAVRALEISLRLERQLQAANKNR